MRVTLHVVAGPQIRTRVHLDQHDTFMIGRSEDSHFCLPHDRFFSRHHCILEIAPPQAFLRDLGSTNGTFVNGIRVETAHLKNGRSNTGRRDRTRGRGFGRHRGRRFDDDAPTSVSRPNRR